MPKLIQAAAKLPDWQVTMLVALPYLAALVVMLLVGRSSDRTEERRWHTVVPVWAAALGLAGTVMFQDRLALLVPFLCLATAGVCGFIPTFWSMTTSRVAGRPGAVAVGLINSTGNLGGFVGPYAMGFLKTATDRYSAGLIYLIAAAIVAGVLALRVDLEQLGEVA